MTTIAETFQSASFAGLKFPCSRVRMRGGLRHHVHVFPHSPGGDPEKMARQLYTVEMTCFFHELPQTDFEEEYPTLYPTQLVLLQKLFEQGKTDNLVIPNVGTMKAFATDWDRDFDFAKAMSGESTVFTFLEDQEKATLFENDFEFGANTMGAKVHSIVALWGTPNRPPPSIFQTINDAVTAVLAVEGVADASSKLLEAKVRAVADLCSQADRLTEMQDPLNHAALRALKDLWLTASKLADDILQKQDVIATWRVPKVMAVTQVASAIYGDAERAMEILQLNPIEDAFAIPAGTLVRYYQTA